MEYPSYRVGKIVGNLRGKVLTDIKRLEVEYECIEIDPEYADTARFCEKYGYPMEKSCNTIIVASKKEPKKYCACVVLSTTRLDVNKRVRKLMGVTKVSFASVEEMNKLTGMEVGGVTVFGLPENLPLFIDRRIMELDWIILGGGSRDIKIKTYSKIFLKLNAVIINKLSIGF